MSIAVREPDKVMPGILSLLNRLKFVRSHSFKLDFFVVAWPDSLRLHGYGNP
jgi:hypothetical protein